MLSIPDMALLGAAALMFFGPEQLPKVARKVGLLVRDVQNTSQSFIREMERAGEDLSYGGPDISRAHLLEDPVPPAVPYEPFQDVASAYDPFHDAAPEHESPLHDASAVEPYAAAPAHHDVMPPRPAHGPTADRDLPP